MNIENKFRKYVLNEYFCGALIPGMQFVNPYFLFGLLAVGIPIVVHLFNFRRFRKVYFTNVRYLEELKQQTQKQSRLKHLLILLLRILAIICLVLAFAQPYIPVSRKAVNDDIRNLVSVFVDNSFSMEARSPKGSLLDEAKLKASEIALAYKPGDLFQLVTCNFEGRHQRFVNREEFLELLQEVKISPSSRKISEVWSRQKDMLSSFRKTNKLAYVISDFQSTVSDVAAFKPDSTIQHYLIPVKGNQGGNVYVDSCWLETPIVQLNQQVHMIARVKNSSSADYEKIPVKLFVNGAQRAVASLDCKAGEQVEISLSFASSIPGIQHGYIEIIDYPTVWDDKMYFSYPVVDQIPVLVINDKSESPFLNSLFNIDSTFLFSSLFLRNLDYSALKSNNMVILNELENIPSGLGSELKNFVSQGGSLVVIPPSGMDAAIYNGFLHSMGPLTYLATDTVNTTVSEINTTHPLYRGVFEKVPENINLPVVLSHYPIQIAARASAQVLLKLSNTDPFLCSFEESRGRLFLLASPLNPDAGNFARHAIFVPTFYQLALLSQPASKIFYTIGANEPIEYRGGDNTGENVFKIRKQQGSQEFIPEFRRLAGTVAFYPHEQVSEAGNYSLMDNATVLKGLAFNYDRKESDMRCLEVDELSKAMKDNKLSDYFVLDSEKRPLAQTINELSRGIRYWKLFAFLALLFLLAEVSLLRFWK